MPTGSSVVMAKIEFRIILAPCVVCHLRGTGLQDDLLFLETACEPRMTVYSPLCECNLDQVIRANT